MSQTEWDLTTKRVKWGARTTHKRSIKHQEREDGGRKTGEKVDSGRQAADDRRQWRESEPWRANPAMAFMSPQAVRMRRASAGLLR